MCDNISLCAIFRELLNDDNFLNIEYIEKPKKSVKSTLNFSNNITSNLEIGNKKNYNAFSPIEKLFLTESHYKFGIISKIDFNDKIINSSFINSLNVCYIGKQIYSNYPTFFFNFEKYIQERLEFNYQIDKGPKNNKKIKENNKLLSMELAEKEEKSDVLIKRIANVLESNILLFDRDTDPESVYLFHSSGNKYSHLNLFNKLIVISRLKNVYEPILVDDNIDVSNKIVYINILKNIEMIENYKEIKIDLLTWSYVYDPNVDIEHVQSLLNHMHEKII